ncbi:heterokaryon incompatibility protein-domain-containing protein [Xylariaceae sp. FL0016]|nr:heterokaryon incompatibility protein-domain-containing protein [Xylariaceae sp. FL0016]
MVLDIFRIFGLGSKEYPGPRLRGPRSIRVLKPKSFDHNGLQCKLKTIKFIDGKDVDYIAISYRWGDMANPETIFCNGMPFKIQNSLYGALLEIWSQKPGALLWADAICIDQIDIEERSSQVKLMGSIYEKATSVVVWLGEADQYTELAWSALNMASSLEKLDQLFTLRQSLTQVGDIGHVWFSIHMIANREWFYRAWTFQELYLAKHVEVLCSTYTMEWNPFYHALSNISNCLEEEHVTADSSRARDSLRKLLSSVERLLLPDTTFTLTDLLARTVNRSCVDRKDKIYSLLGVLFRTEDPEYLQEAIQVNYRGSSGELYTKVARDLACRAQWTEPGVVRSRPHDLHVLHGAGLDAHVRSRTPLRGLPTWVVNWTDNEATSAWAEMTYTNPQDWKPIIRLEGIKLGAAIKYHVESGASNQLQLYGVALARLAPIQGSSSSRRRSARSLVRFYLEDIPRCAYNRKLILPEKATTDSRFKRWAGRSSSTPIDDEKRYPPDAKNNIYDADMIARACLRHDKSDCPCSQTPYLQTLKAVVLAYIIGSYLPSLTLFLIIWIGWSAMKDYVVQGTRPSRNFRIDVQYRGAFNTEAGAGDWIVALAGKQGLFLLKPAHDGKFELVRGLLRHPKSLVNWEIHRVSPKGDKVDGWASSFAEPGEHPSIPSWKDFRGLPVKLTLV